MTEAKRPRPAQAIESRRASSQQKVRNVEKAIRMAARDGTPVTPTIIAAKAGVSRTFLYTNPEAAAAIEAAVGQEPAEGQFRRGAGVVSEGSWHARALNAEEALAKARAELASARSEIGDLLGQLRDPDGTRLREDRDRLRVERESLLRERNELRQTLRRAENQLGAARSAADRARRSAVAELFPQGPGKTKHSE